MSADERAAATVSVALFAWWLFLLALRAGCALYLKRKDRT